MHNFKKMMRISYRNSGEFLDDVRRLVFFDRWLKRKSFFLTRVKESLDYFRVNTSIPSDVLHDVNKEIEKEGARYFQPEDGCVTVEISRHMALPVMVYAVLWMISGLFSVYTFMFVGSLASTELLLTDPAVFFFGQVSSLLLMFSSLK